VKNIWKKHRSFLLILILVFLLRLPLLFEPFTYADEGIYLTLGQAIRKGLVLYRDIHDNKPPMLYLLAALAGSFPLYRLIHFLWSFATIFAFYKLAQVLFAKKQKPVLVTTGVFAILTSLHTFEGNIGNAENFMLLPTLGGFYLFLKSLQSNLNQTKGPILLTGNNFSFIFFIVGVLFSLAVLFKVPAVFDFAAILVFILFTFIFSRKNYRPLIKFFFLVLLGFALPLLISVAYFSYKNALSQYLTAAFLQNFPYLSSWGGEKMAMGKIPLSLLARALGLMLIIILLFTAWRKIGWQVKLVIVWFSFSLFAALLSSRPYPHYLIQVLPSFSLSFGLLSFNKIQKKLKFIPALLVLIFVLTFVFFRFWYYPNLPYLKNFYQFLLGFKSHQEYLVSFDKTTPKIYQTANFIKNHTQAEEKIFIWGTYPSIYALSQRLPVGRYTVSYHIIDFNAYQETLAVLEKNQPRWIIIAKDEKKPFWQLKKFVEDNYTPFEQKDDLEIFYRLPKVSRL